MKMLPSSRFLVLPLLLTACAGAACAANTAAPASPGVASAPAYAPRAGAPDGLAGQPPAKSSGPRAGGQIPVDPNVVAASDIDRQVIRTALLGLRIPAGGFWKAYNAAVQVADRYHGFLSASNAGTPGDNTVDSGSLTISVPTASYADALQSLRALGTPTELQVTSQDVTNQYVDLDARLRNAQAEQAVLLALMQKAQSIPDMINLENELAQVTQQIEELEAQKRLLDQQTAYSTITVQLFVTSPPVPGPNPLQQSGLGDSFSRGLQAFLGVLGLMLVAAGFLLPFGVLTLVGLAAWRLRPGSLRPSARP